MSDDTQQPKSSASEISAADEPSSEPRRSFLGSLLGLGSVVVGALLSVPLIRFALFPLIRRTTEVKWSPVGDESEFSSITNPVTKTVEIEHIDGWRKAISVQTVYVTKNSQDQLAVLSSICPHLGCTIPFVSGKNEFICPCHGGTFAPDGTLISGPPQRGMDSLETSREDGKLMVRFQYFRQLVADKEVVG
jgi:menaquinol-cytochrome c reductase iron-sulfur subunit